eukprot:5393703-Alexandrium_andersonii.AAC.1
MPSHLYSRPPPRRCWARERASSPSAKHTRGGRARLFSGRALCRPARCAGARALPADALRLP